MHDAVLIEAPVDEIDSATAAMQSAMVEASALVLGGFRLRTTVEQVVRYPNRFMDEKRGRRMWEIIRELVDVPSIV